MDAHSILEARQYNCRYDCNAPGCVCYPRSAWSDWVRWVVLGVIVVAILLLFFMCSCFSARRRRRAGRNPFYGTGWAAGRTAPGHGVPQYNNTNAQPYYNANQDSQPAPPYSPPQQGGYYAPPQGQNASYFNQQQSGVELSAQPQYPQPAYTQPAYNRGGDDVYAPPAGPPPAKDGIIR